MDSCSKIIIFLVAINFATKYQKIVNCQSYGSQSQVQVNCGENFYKCKVGICIEPSLVCDKNKDCPIDGDDEDGCVRYVGKNKSIICAKASSECACFGMKRVKSFQFDLNCKNAGLVSLPTIISEDIYEMNLVGNKISKLTSKAFGNRARTLYSLVLSQNEITIIEKNAFKNLNRMSMLFLGDNKISTLKSGIFDNLEVLYTLDLRKNEIKTIQPGTFKYLKTLSKLYLSGNKLTELTSNMFEGLTQLDTLHLSENQIYNIEPKALYDLGKVQYLDFSHNQVSNLSSKTFEGLIEVEHLNLRANKINIIENNVWRQLENLKQLFLDANQISNLTSNVFEGLTGLEELHLNANNIRYIENQTFEVFKSLTILDMANNEISDLRSKLFYGMKGRIALNLQGNKIKVIKYDTFEGIDMLYQLDLSGNKISKLTSRVFEIHQELADLRLGGNEISDIENNAFVGLRNLNTLMLDNNKISKLKSGTFQSTPFLSHLYLQRNEIVDIEKDIFEGHERLLYLDLSNNGLSKLMWSIFKGLRDLKRLKLIGNKIVRIENRTFIPQMEQEMINEEVNDELQIEEKLSSLFESENERLELKWTPLLGQLEELFLSKNKITHIENGAFSGLENLYTLDLGENQISKLSPAIFEGIGTFRSNRIHKSYSEAHLYDRNGTVLTPSSLNLQKNVIDTIEAKTFASFTNLTILDLSENKISELSSEMFEGLEQLRILNLYGNEIDTVEEQTFMQFEYLKKLNLTKNRIHWRSENIFEQNAYLDYLATDEYRLCCFLKHLRECYPTLHEFSSCDELLEDRFLRICITIVGSIAISANVFVVIFRTKYNKFYTNKINSFLVKNLAISDSFMGCYLLIVAVADTIFREKYHHHDFRWRFSTWCTSAGVISTFSSSLTAFILIIMAIERLLLIKYPYQKKVLKFNQVRIPTAFAWLIAVVIASLPIPWFRISYFKHFYNRSGICLPLHISANKPNGWQYSVLVFMVLHSIAFAMFASSFILMTRLSIKSRQSIKSDNALPIVQKVMIFRVVLFVLVDATCKFPIIVLGIRNVLGQVTSMSLYAWLVIFVSPLNAALNPILYTITSLLSTFKFFEYIQKRKLRCPIQVKVNFRSLFYLKGQARKEEIELTHWKQVLER